MMEAVRTSETSVDNYFTRQYIPEDSSNKIMVPPLLKLIVALLVKELSVFYGTRRFIIVFTRRRH